MLKSYVFPKTIHQNSYMFQSSLDNFQEGVFLHQLSLCKTSMGY